MRRMTSLSRKKVFYGKREITEKVMMTIERLKDRKGIFDFSFKNSTELTNTELANFN